MNRKEITQLTNKLSEARYSNSIAERYYDGKQRLKDMGISLPPGMAYLGVASDWPRIAVDAVANRLILRGVTHSDPAINGMVQHIVRTNNLINELHFAIRDSLIFGTSFISVHNGDSASGEPEIMITAESPNTVTGAWSARAKRLTHAVKITGNDDSGVMQGLAFDDKSVWRFDSKGEQLVYEHNLGRVPIVRFCNNVRSSEPWGTSDINKSIRYYTDAANRTLAGAEVSREFFNSPQRYILGADESLFMDENGNPTDAWESYIGRFLAIENNENGTTPKVGTFDANSPAPYIDLLSHLSKMCASAADVPAEYFGLTNQSLPSSADAIRANEERLVQKVRSKVPGIVLSVQDVFDVAFKLLGITTSEPVRVHMSNPATPTPAATADMLTKLQSIGAVSATSDWLYEQLGMDVETMELVRAELAKSVRTGLLAEIMAGANKVRESDPDVAEVNRTTHPEVTDGEN